MGEAPIQHRSLAAPLTWAGFVEGFAVPREGFTHMCRHPGLWRYAVIPILLNVLITASILFLLVAAAVFFAVRIHPWFEGVWGWRVLEVVTAVALLLVVAAGALGAWVLLNGILCGHFYTKLAREVELQLGMRPEDIRDVPFSYQVADAFRDLAALVAVNVGLLALNVIPLIGSVAAVVLTLYFDWMIFGREFLDFPLALRGLRRDEKRAFARRHRPHTLGLGAAVFLCNFIPVIGSVVLSTAAAGSVLLHRRLRQAEASAEPSPHAPVALPSVHPYPVTDAT